MAAGMSSDGNPVNMSSDAKPAASSAAERSAGAAQCVTSPTLGEICSRLSSMPSQTSAQQLLEDIPILEAWQRAPHPSNAVRDAMLKLGKHWNVQGKVKGKKRAPADVAQEIEQRMLRTGSELLTSGQALQPGSLREMFARQKRSMPPQPASQDSSKQPRLEHVGSSSSAAAAERG